ncbi:hypothetical protein LZ554_007041 [Drepanopeziza brunnea f. sp. 'monogermtubi']|nr:hypothetical protein LZ554_007041 [Drepanopeziza brunnea f. sp. 'monogermtubi']
MTPPRTPTGKENAGSKYRSLTKAAKGFYASVRNAYSSPRRQPSQDTWKGSTPLDSDRSPSKRPVGRRSSVGNLLSLFSSSQSSNYEYTETTKTTKEKSEGFAGLFGHVAMRRRKSFGPFGSVTNMRREPVRNTAQHTGDCNEAISIHVTNTTTATTGHTEDCNEAVSIHITEPSGDPELPVENLPLADTTEPTEAPDEAVLVHVTEPSAVFESYGPEDKENAYQQLIASGNDEISRVLSMPDSMRPMLSRQNSRASTPVRSLLGAERNRLLYHSDATHFSNSGGEEIDPVTHLLDGCEYEVRAHTPDPSAWEQAGSALRDAMPMVTVRPISPTSTPVDIDPDFRRRHAERTEKFIKLDLDPGVCTSQTNDTSFNGNILQLSRNLIAAPAALVLGPNPAADSNATSLGASIDSRTDVWKANTDNILEAIRSTVAKMTRNYHGSAHHRSLMDEGVSFAVTDTHSQPTPSYSDFEKERDDFWESVKTGQAILQGTLKLQDSQTSLSAQSEVSWFDPGFPADILNFRSTYAGSDFSLPLPLTPAKKRFMLDDDDSSSGSPGYLDVFRHFDKDLFSLPVDSILQNSILFRTPLDPFDRGPARMVQMSPKKVVALPLSIDESPGSDKFVRRTCPGNITPFERADSDEIETEHTEDAQFFLPGPSQVFLSDSVKLMEEIAEHPSGYHFTTVRKYLRSSSQGSQSSANSQSLVDIFQAHSHAMSYVPCSSRQIAGLSAGSSSIDKRDDERWTGDTDFS